MKTITMDVKVAALMAIGHLDDLLHEPCCPVCCGPCWALKSLVDSGQLDELVGLRGWARNAGWWDRETSQVDRAWLAEVWPASACNNHLEGEN